MRFFQCYILSSNMMMLWFVRFTELMSTFEDVFHLTKPPEY